MGQDVGVFKRKILSLILFIVNWFKLLPDISEHLSWYFVFHSMDSAYISDSRNTFILSSNGNTVRTSRVSINMTFIVPSDSNSNLFCLDRPMNVGLGCTPSYGPSRRGAALKLISTLQYHITEPVGDHNKPIVSGTIAWPGVVVS